MRSGVFATLVHIIGLQKKEFHSQQYYGEPVKSVSELRPPNCMLVDIFGALRVNI